MGGLTKKIEGLKGQFQELVWSEGGLNSFLKGLIDLGTGILKFANSDGGQFVLFTTLAITGVMGLKVAFDKLTISMSANPIGLILIALSGLITLIGVAINSVQEADTTLQDLHDTATQFQNDINESSSVISSLESQLDSLNSKIKELQSQDSLSITDEQQLSLLQQQETSLENQLKIEQEKLRLAKEQSSESAKTALKQTVTWVDDKTGNTSEITRQEGLSKTIQLTKDMEAEYNNLESELANMSQANETDTKLYKEKTERYNELNTIISAQRETMVDLASDLAEEASQLDLTVEGNQKLYDAVQVVIGEYNSFTGATDEASQATSNFTDETEEEIDGLSESKQALEDAKTALEEYKDALSDLSSMDDAFITLNDAIAEYNSSGEFTLDTLDNLLSLGDEYLALLEFENGQVSLNKDGAIALANAKIDEAEAKAYSSAMAELNASAQNEEADAIDNASASASASVSANVSASNGVYGAIIACTKGTVAWNNYWSAQSRGAINNGVSGDKATEIGKSLNSQLKALESLRGNLGKVTTATTTNTRATGGNTSAKKSNTDATKAQTDALKKQKEALEDEIDQYERAISYIIDLLDEEIDKLEERRDTEIDTTQAEIDKIKEKQDVIETSVNEQISLYEEQKKAREDFWDSEIDKIKESSDALDDRIERQKLLDNITSAKKKKVLVYTENGFEYQQDQEALTKAKQELANYDAKKNKEKQIKTLEEKKEAESKIYDDEIDDLNDYLAKLKKTNDDEIADLNAHIKKVESKYNKKINYLKDYKKKFEDQTKAYKKAQDKLLAEQLTGINFENSNWKTRLGNLNTFVKNYNEKLASVTEVTNKLNQLAKEAEAAAKRINDAISGAGGGSGGSTDSGTSSYTVFQIIKEYSTSGEASSKISSDNADGYTSYGGKYVTYKKKGTYSTETEASSQANSLNTSAQGKSRYGFKALATGSSYVDNDGMFLVGDNPSNNELVIGSKLNGSLMNLSKGSGVVNAKSTNTLAGILNNLSSMGNGHTSNLALNAQGMNLYIDNLNLPQVSDGIGFVEYIKSNAKSLAIQYGSKR